MISFVDHLAYLLLRFIVEDEEHVITKCCPITVRDSDTVIATLSGFIEELEDVLEKAESREIEPSDSIIMTVEETERSLHDELREGGFLDEYTPMELERKMHEAFLMLETRKSEKVISLVKTCIYNAHVYVEI